MNDIVLITSVINTGIRPWSYINARSTYTPEQRFQQTLETIESIHVYLPNAKVFLVECSDIPEEYTAELCGKVDYFLNLFENSIVRSACLETNKKGFGEAVQTKYAIEYLLQENIQFRRFFKISGRYSLNENFRQENYLDDRYTFKKRVITGDNKIAMSTVVFSFPFQYLRHFHSVVDEVVEYYNTHEPKGYEELLPIRCEPRSEIDVIGVSGYVAVTQNEFFTA
jgi:hypothetical protein